MADDFEIPTSPEDAILAAGKGQDETVDSIIDYSSDVMGGAALLGGEEAAATLLAGGAAELGVGAAAAGGATIGAAVLGAGAAGVGIGMLIENETGIGSASGDALYDISDPNDAQAALHHSEAASEAWDQGNYGTAAVEAAETAGSMIEGVWDGLTGGSSEE
jgi:hypothetical protein